MGLASYKSCSPVAISGSVALPGNSTATAPGEMIVVRMLHSLTYCRRPSDKVRTACLVAVYTALLKLTLWSATEDTLVNVGLRAIGSNS